MYYIWFLFLFYFRVSKLNKRTAVYPAEIAQTYRLEHKADSGNPINYNRYIWPDFICLYFSYKWDTLIYHLRCAAEVVKMEKDLIHVLKYSSTLCMHTPVVRNYLLRARQVEGGS